MNVKLLNNNLIIQLDNATTITTKLFNLSGKLLLAFPPTDYAGGFHTISLKRLFIARGDYILKLCNGKEEIYKSVSF